MQTALCLDIRFISKNSQLHAKGFQEHHLSEAVRRIKFHQEMIDALHHLHGKEALIRIVSDANTFFISEILQEHHLLPIIDKVITNPAHFSAQGWPLRGFTLTMTAGC